MTLLPLIERELRAQARNRATYWTRFVAGLVGAIICLPELGFGGALVSAGSLGQQVFGGLVETALLLACGAGLLTVDVISAERREGTLDLLLMTRAKGMDLLLGKLVAASITALCSLLAFLPLLLIPALAGGVTGGEVFRKGLLLVNTAFFALTTGLCVSVLARAERNLAALATLTLTAAVVLVPESLFWVRGRFTFLQALSPLAGLTWATDSSYGIASGRYWTSLALIHALGWLMLVAGGLGLRFRLREDAVAGVFARPLGNLPDGETPASMSRRRTSLDSANPLQWRLDRAYTTSLKTCIWAAVVAVFLYRVFWMFLGGYWGPRWFGFVFAAAIQGPELVLQLLIQGLIAYAASQFYIEARRTGELELLLTTPLGMGEILSAQCQSLKRLLIQPVLAMMVFHVLTIAVAVLLVKHTHSPIRWAVDYFSGSLLMGVLVPPLQATATCWLALWFGLNSRGMVGAIVRATALSEGVPCLFTCFFTLVLILAATGGRSGLSYWGIVWIPGIARLLFFIWAIRWAGRRLRPWRHADSQV